MILLSTGSLFDYGTARVFELAAEAGFDGIEVIIDQRWDTRQPEYLLRLSQATGLPVPVVHSPFVPHVPGWPLDALGRLRVAAAVARALGAGVLVAHLPPRLRAARLDLPGRRGGQRWLPLPLPVERAYHHLLANGLAEFEAAERVRVGVENMPARRVLGRRVNAYALNTPKRWGEMPHLTLDTTHLGTWGLDPLSTYRRFQSRVVHVHLSNFDGLEHRLPDDGLLPLGALLRCLAGDGYAGAVTLEVHPAALGAEDEARVRENLRRACSFMRQHLGGDSD